MKKNKLLLIPLLALCSCGNKNVVNRETEIREMMNLSEDDYLSITKTSIPHTVTIENKNNKTGAVSGTTYCYLNEGYYFTVLTSSKSIKVTFLTEVVDDKLTDKELVDLETAQSLSYWMSIYGTNIYIVDNPINDNIYFEDEIIKL